MDVLFSIIGGLVFKDKIIEEGWSGLKTALTVGGCVSLIAIAVSWPINPTADAQKQLSTLIIGVFVGAIFAEISAQISESYG